MDDQRSGARRWRERSENRLDPPVDFNSLSVTDLLEARNLYHLYLTDRRGIVGTAIGRYLIRREDTPVHKGKGPKTLDRVEVRDYSWPCVIVFVERWLPEEAFRGRGARPGDRLPDCLRMPNGKVVPVCVVQAPAGAEPVPERRTVFPKTVIGGGYPVIAEVQGEERVASIGCLVTDGRLTYALTNRHVAGRAGETLYSLLGGQKCEIGHSADKQLGRLPFGELYEGWPGQNVYVNADVGLIELGDKNQWTPQIYGVGPIGEVADLSIENLSLRLVGCDVKAYGCMGHEMAGHVWALFFRYKSMGGFEYVADLFIGPRPGGAFQTYHGDSGTIWLLDPHEPTPRQSNTRARNAVAAPPADAADALPKPLAVQWGGTVVAGAGVTGQSYALATLLSTVCARLEVDLVRDWGQALPQYWGTVGHFTIANLACALLKKPATKLGRLMTNNLENITFQLETITDQATKGLSKAHYIPLADVPDLMWKLGPHSRGPRGNNPEGPNHFADMDQAPPGGGPTLLDLCRDADNIVPDAWIEHARLFPPKSGNGTDPAKEAGLLPFRVWQIYDAMVEMVAAGDTVGFVAAAGVLAHYVGDACQPLHVSYLHHGDPEHFVTKTVEHTRGKKAGTSEEVNVSQGVHADYEQNMFARQNGEQMKKRLAQALAGTTRGEAVRGGRAAAIRTVQLMRTTLDKLKPTEIVEDYDRALRAGTAKSAILNGLWQTFGDKTIEVMAEGCRVLALLWESAWAEGRGTRTIADDGELKQDDLAKRCEPKSFLPSCWLTDIGEHLKGLPQGSSKPAPVAAKKGRAAVGGGRRKAAASATRRRRPGAAPQKAPREDRAATVRSGRPGRKATRG